MDVQFRIDAFDVHPHGVDAQGKIISDLLVLARSTREARNKSADDDFALLSVVVGGALAESSRPRFD
jgi:hypothetical protein